MSREENLKVVHVRWKRMHIFSPSSDCSKTEESTDGNSLANHAYIPKVLSELVQVCCLDK
jgi:hypothetical protein